MKKTIWIAVVFVSLVFSTAGVVAADRQRHDADEPQRITNASDRARKQQVDKPQQVANPSKKGKKIVIPGKDLS
jgi:hypothetical protein